PPVLVHAAITTNRATLSLHDALPISLFHQRWRQPVDDGAPAVPVYLEGGQQIEVPMAVMPEETAATPFPPLTEPELQGTLQLSLDRKSTRLNSSHVKISYAVCCWKDK